MVRSIDNNELNSSTATTQSQGDNSTKVATTAYVDAAANGVDLQDAYDNGNGEIITDATNGAVVFKRGSASDGDDVISIENGAGTQVFKVDGDGDVSCERILLKDAGTNVGNINHTTANTIEMTGSSGVDVKLRSFQGDVILDADNILINGITVDDNDDVMGVNSIDSNSYTGTWEGDEVASQYMDSGSILQVEQSVVTGVFTTSANSWVTWSALDTAITPTSGRASNSRFKISFCSGVSSSVQNSYQYVRLQRVVSGVATTIAQGNSVGSLQRCWIDAALGLAYTSSSHQAIQKPLAGEFVDSPNTSSTVTYRVQVRRTANGVAMFGRTSNTSDANRSSTISTLTVMEIAQ